jgi:hypothetical protein
MVLSNQEDCWTWLVDYLVISEKISNFASLFGEMRPRMENHGAAF